MHRSFRLAPTIVTALVVLFASTNSATCQSLQPDRESSRVTPHIGAELPIDVIFQDETGRDVRLGDLLVEKPVVLLPVYYKCPMLCGLELKGLLRCLRAMELNVGQDFEVIAFSFDPKEKPSLAAQKKKQTVRDYGRANSADGWHFLTGSRESSELLCDAIGFRTTYDKRSGQYAHVACLVVIAPDGRICRYFYGVEFVPREMKLALIEASDGQVGTIADQIQLLCFAYDPATGKYGFAILRTLQTAGILTVVILISCIGRFLWLESHRRTSRMPAGGA